MRVWFTEKECDRKKKKGWEVVSFTSISVLSYTWLSCLVFSSTAFFSIIVFIVVRTIGFQKSWNRTLIFWYSCIREISSLLLCHSPKGTLHFPFRRSGFYYGSYYISYDRFCSQSLWSFPFLCLYSLSILSFCKFNFYLWYYNRSTALFKLPFLSIEIVINFTHI